MICFTQTVWLLCVKTSVENNLAIVGFDKVFDSVLVHPMACLFVTVAKMSRAQFQATSFVSAILKGSNLSPDNP